MPHNAALADIQSEKPEIEIPVDRVGVSGLAFQLTLRDRANGSQIVTARASLSVDLPACRRGTHMSRLVEALDKWKEPLGCQSMRRLLATMRERLEAANAFARFEFAYQIRRAAPVSGLAACQGYDCAVLASLTGDKLAFAVDLKAPVMTVCPCSLAIATVGAHCQRAIARLNVSMDKFIWLEDLIAVAENAGSSPVFPLLKREDEKYVTELAFSRPAFVEDVARRIAGDLLNFENITAFTVEVESMESIHNHNAFASITRSR